MPAMPKENTAAAVSLSESNFAELKLKELTVVDASITTTVTTTTSSVGSLYQSQLQHQPRSGGKCGCGNTSVTDASSTTSVGHSDVMGMREHNFFSNGHLSPLADAVDASSTSSLSEPVVDSTWSLSPERHNTSYSHPVCKNSQLLNDKRTANETSSNAHYNNTYTSMAYKSSGSCNSDPSSTANGISSNGVRPSSASQVIKTHKGSNENNATTITPPKKSPKDYIFGRYIGEGSFSNVYLAVDVHTSNEFAIKVCDKRHILRENKQEYIRREREVMHMMTNVPGFVNLSCTFQDSRSLYFVMTYAQNGDLLPFITKVGSFDMDCARHYAAELVLACEQLHSRNVIHRDLKPENILLDENMHTMIADFGSAKIFNTEERELARSNLLEARAQKQQLDEKTANGDIKCSVSNIGGKKIIRSTAGQKRQMRRNQHSSGDDDEDCDQEKSCGDESSNVDSDDMDSPQSNYHDRRRRRYSFVGTAQYVSPEVLQNGPITPAADLWALGCIIYQMISGLPPFRGSNEYVIFREILNGHLEFPNGFDMDAEDLVRKLLRLSPEDRLGALDEGDRYNSIRSHAFFKYIDFDKVRKQKAPPICPFLPDVAKDADLRATIRNLEPGLDDRQLTRLIGMELGTTFSGDQVDGISDTKKHLSDISSPRNGKTNTTRNSFDLSQAEKQMRLDQQKSDKWHIFAHNEVILKKGFVNKRKGLFARKRMLLLTTGPHLVYIDPVQMIKKGEIPWSPELRVEAKNFKIFLVHTPNRTYYLDDPEGYSLHWVDAIDKMRHLTYKANDTPANNCAISQDTATSGPTSIAAAVESLTAITKSSKSKPIPVDAPFSTSTLSSSSPNMYVPTPPLKSTSTSN